MKFQNYFKELQFSFEVNSRVSSKRPAGEYYPGINLKHTKRAARGREHTNRSLYCDILDRNDFCTPFSFVNDD